MTRPRSQAGVPVDPTGSARDVGLNHASDASPGWTRKRSGQSFRFLDAAGKPVRDADEFRRIKALVIPPAWTDVWISPDPLGHLQATGRDAKGRKQYRYHAHWRSTRDENK